MNVHDRAQPSYAMDLLVALDERVTGLQALDEVIGKLQKRGVHVMLCEANHRVRAKLWNAGVLDTLRDDDYSDEFAPLLARSEASSASIGSKQHHHLSEAARRLLETSHAYFRDDFR